MGGRHRRRTFVTLRARRLVFTFGSTMTVNVISLRRMDINMLDDTWSARYQIRSSGHTSLLSHLLHKWTNCRKASWRMVV
jgi:hypothetical protein